MIVISIIVLFVLQLIAFFFIVLLNVKMARFNQLEEKQNRLMREMDETVGAYLMQLQEENNRFIQALKDTPKPSGAVIQEPLTMQVQVNESSVVEQPSVNREPEEVKVPKFTVPKTKAKAAYQKHIKSPAAAEEQPSKVIRPPTLEQQVVQLADEGKSIEQIAKQLQKGKTEIELLLKFKQ